MLVWNASFSCLSSSWQPDTSHELFADLQALVQICLTSMVFLLGRGRLPIAFRLQQSSLIVEVEPLLPHRFCLQSLEVGDMKQPQRGGNTGVCKNRRAQKEVGGFLLVSPPKGPPMLGQTGVWTGNYAVQKSLPMDFPSIRGGLLPALSPVRSAGSPSRATQAPPTHRRAPGFSDLAQQGFLQLEDDTHTRSVFVWKKGRT